MSHGGWKPSLTEYENVKIHYFSTDEEIIYDFGNYLDSAHYKSAINEYMVMCIGKGDHLLKKEDVEKTEEQLNISRMSMTIRLFLQLQEIYGKMSE